MPDPQRIAATVHALAELDLPAALPELALVGITRGRVRSALDAGALAPVRRGFWVPASLWAAATPDDRHDLALKAALRAFPGAWASRQSAARLHGLPHFDAPAAPTDVPHVHLSRAGTTWREPGLSVHGNEVPDTFVGITRGLRSTDLVRTAIELAAGPSRRRALAVLDAAMRLEIARCSNPARVRHQVRDPVQRERARYLFDAAVAPFARHRWVTTVRYAVQHADPAAESVLESLSRWSILDDGLPAPQCGVPRVGDDGNTYWVDMWWDDQKVVGEADGRSKYGSVDDLVAEKRRQEALEGSGCRFVRWGWDEGVTHPSVMLARMRRVLRT